MNEFTNCCRDSGIFPLCTAGVGGVTVTDVDDDINGIKDGGVVADIVDDELKQCILQRTEDRQVGNTSTALTEKGNVAAQPSTSVEATPW